jgi:hypothetical protein
MKIIFLDIDGVLNSIDSMVAFHGCNEKHLDKVSIGLLKRLCEATDAKIVISSTWRKGRTIADFVGIFSFYGWDNAPIIGRTPVKDSKRGLEIHECLLYHPEVTDFVILDDDSDMLDSQLQNFVHVSNINGFRSQHFCKALRVLGCPDDRLEQQVNFVRKSGKGL